MITKYLKTARLYLISLLFAALFLATGRAGAFELLLAGNKLSVEADNVALQDLLRDLTYYDIAVRIDPKINPRITVAFHDRDLEEGLKSIIRPYDHVFIWKLAKGASPAGSGEQYRLQEIQIFEPGKKELMVTMEIPPSEPPNPSATESEVTIKGNKVFVPVILGYKDREIETTLLFDTGAGSMVLHQEIARRLNIDNYTESTGRGVGGVEINTRIAQLSYVSVGPHTKRALRADIVAYQGPPDELYNGLLGMNFLRGLKYSIDFEHQVIHWLP